jgi:choline kinase
MDTLPESAAATPSASTEEAQSQQTHSHHRHRPDIVTERLLSQVAEWLEREKVKKQYKTSRGPHGRRRSPPSDASIPAPAPGRARGDSIGSDSSEVSLDRLQRILDDNMAALGLNSLSQLVPRFGRRHRKRSSKNLTRTASSDTEWFDGDVVVPGCDGFLDNSKTLAYTGGKAGADDSASISSRKEEKERQNWVTFKNEIIRLAHTLRLKGWKRVPLDSGESISVERLSGALTNAVYVVSPPSESLLPREPGKKQPGKVLLRIYGPQVEHLIDRENELGVLRRLARKKIGPRLLGTFLNGRFEQYLNAAPLTMESMRESDTSRQIAKRMRELHDGVELLDEEKDQGPGVWKNWDKWLSQVEKTVLFLDRQILFKSQTLPGGVWRSRGFVCGVQWPVFKALVDKYRRHLEAYYGDAKRIRDKLVFAHNDVGHSFPRPFYAPLPPPPLLPSLLTPSSQTQYGNILRVRPDDQKSPLLQPANEHKQLVVIDFEYAAANLPGLEFANHFTEWTYNYHDPARPYACDASRYPTPDQQRRFVKAYINHRPQFPYVDSPAASPAPSTPAGAPGAPPSGGLHAVPSTSSIVEFMLDARVPAGGWKEEERKREEEAEGKVKALLEETRLWRTANSAQWVAWGIVQAKIPGLDTTSTSTTTTGSGATGSGEGVAGVERKEGLEGALEAGEGNGVAAVENVKGGKGGGVNAGEVECEDGGEEEFDYLSYAQERAFFFLGDCVLMGLVKPEELGEEVRRRIKLVEC